MDGWNAELDAEIFNGLGITSEYHDLYMRDLDGNQKVKVLLAQALFGDLDILLLLMKLLPTILILPASTG